MKNRIKDELIDELLSSYDNPAELLGSDGLLNELKKRLIERTMDAELSNDLGYEKHARGAAKEKRIAAMGTVKRSSVRIPALLKSRYPGTVLGSMSLKSSPSMSDILMVLTMPLSACTPEG